MSEQDEQKPKDVTDQIEKMWQEILEVQCKAPQTVNTMAAAHMLRMAEEALSESAPNRIKARYRLVSAKLWLANAQEYAKSWVLVG